MEDQRVRRPRPFPWRHRRAQLLLDHLRIVRSRNPDAIRDAQHVPVDRQPGHAERVPEDDVRGLAPDARQLDELLHRLRHLAAVPLDDLRRPCPASERDFARKKPVDWICGSSSSVVAFASDWALGYRLKSAGVTWFTRSSVHCADRIVATSSSYGFE